MKRLSLLLIALILVQSLAVGQSPAISRESAPTSASAWPVAPCPDSSPIPRANATNYSDVLLLINNQSQLSMQVGGYFKEKRAVPDRNVCNISMPTSEWINPTQFGTVRTAVESFITAAGLNSTLNYIVTTKGCPLGVWDSNNRYASFMDELGLMLGPYAGSIGNQYWMSNPYGGSEERFSRQREGFFIVTRIDGYDLNDCLRLVDNAANATGSRGTFVLDSQPWKDGSGYKEGNDWCRAANTTLAGKGWKCYLDDTSWYVVDQDNVSGYCSWGSNDGNAPDNAKPHFTWVPGALGSTYVSTSARSFAYPPSYGQSLIADLVREGITGVHGNVAEPYLSACARPQFFLERYTRGWNLGESFYASMATQSWQNCVIGDPKTEGYADQPDPAVLPQDIAFSEPALVQGMTINITARVRNLGGGAAQNTIAAFYNGRPGQGGTQIGENITIDLIPAGGNVSIQVQWDLSPLAGPQVVFVHVIASNITPQLWSGNDIASRNATIFLRPDLIVQREKLTVSHLSPLEGDLVWVNATVRNGGGFVATSLLRFWADAALLLEMNVSLMGGEETRQGAVWDSGGFPGDHRLLVEVLPVPYEAEIANNNASADLFVRHFDLSLSSGAARQDCLPGRTAVFNITVRSLSNTAEAVAVRLSPAPDFWAGTVEPEHVQLDAGASSEHTVTITAPDLGLAGDRWDLQFRCEGLTSGVLRELNLSVGVLSVRELRVSCDPSEASALPGGNASFKLTVRNLGNGPDTAVLSARAPEGWKVDYETTSVDLVYKGSDATLFKVSPPMTALAGERQDILVSATSLGGTSWNASVTVEVEQGYDFASCASVEAISIAPGQESGIVVLVQNHGNGEETFHLTVQVGDLQVLLSAQSITLKAFSGDNVTLKVKVPEKYSGNGERLQITVQPDHSQKAVHEVAVNVVRPDIKVAMGSLKVSPSDPLEGTQVTVSVEVQNAGTAASGPVTVRLSEYGSAVGNFSLDGLAPGGRATVVFTWTAGAAGVHELRVSAECKYRDPTPADSSAAVTVTVAPKKVAGPGPTGSALPSMAVIAGGILLLAAVVALAVMFLLRRRPPARAEPAPSRTPDRAGFSLVPGETGGESRR